MKINLFIGLCLLNGLAAAAALVFVPQGEARSENLQDEMEKRFAIRDTFKEKGNSGRYLKISNLQL